MISLLQLGIPNYASEHLKAPVGLFLTVRVSQTFRNRVLDLSSGILSSLLCSTESCSALKNSAWCFVGGWYEGVIFPVTATLPSFSPQQAHGGTGCEGWATAVCHNLYCYTDASEVLFDLRFLFNLCWQPQNIWLKKVVINFHVCLW